jgi:hypothetical protein
MREMPVCVQYRSNFSQIFSACGWLNQWIWSPQIRMGGLGTSLLQVAEYAGAVIIHSSGSPN